MLVETTAAIYHETLSAGNNDVIYKDHWLPLKPPGVALDKRGMTLIKFPDPELPSLDIEMAFCF